MGQCAGIVLIALVDDERGLADVLKGQRHIVLAVPVDGLRFLGELIPLRCGDLIALVAADGELLGVELDDTGVIGGAGSVEAAVDLLKGDNGACEGVAVLRVDLLDDELFLDGVVDGDVAGRGRMDRHIDRVGDGKASRGLVLDQRIGDIGIEALPAHFSVRAAHAGVLGAVRAAEGELGAGERGVAPVHLEHFQLAGLGDVAAPLQSGVGGDGGLAGVGDDIALRGVVIVAGEIDVVLHDVGAAVDGDLAADGYGVHGDAQLRRAGVFKPVIVERGAFSLGRERPGRFFVEAPVGKLRIAQIGEDIAAGGVVRPQLDAVVVVVGGGGAGKGVFVGVVRLAADHLALESILRVFCRKIQRHIGWDRDVAACFALLGADIHPRLRDERPGVSHGKEELDGAEHAHLLSIARGLGDLLPAAYELGPVDGKLAEGRPHRALCGVGVLVLGQAGEDGVLLQIEAEEGVQRVLGIAVGENARGLGTGGVLAVDGQRLAGEVEPVVDAVRRSGQAVVGRVGVLPRAEGGSRGGFQIVVAGTERHGRGPAAVLDGRGRGGSAHRQERQHGAEGEDQGKRPVHGMRFRSHGVSFLNLGDRRRKQPYFSVAASAAREMAA